MLSDAINCFCLFFVSRSLQHWLLLMPLRGIPSSPVTPFTKLANLAFYPLIYILLRYLCCYLSLSCRYCSASGPYLVYICDLSYVCHIFRGPMSSPGVVFLISLFSDYQDIIATGGVDTNAVVFDRASGQILSALSGHSKKVIFQKYSLLDLFFVWLYSLA